MQDEMTSYLKYLEGEPLTEELARVRAGALDVPEDAAPKRPALPAILDAERELRRQERQQLREILRSPGWGVVRRIQQKLSQTHQKCAMSMSQDDPLNNRDKIAEQWAYVLMFNRAMGELNLLMEAEVSEVEQKGELQ